MRIPLYFGDAGRPLFGWYHAPETGAQRDDAVVICQPLGHEYVNAHRTMRHLADRLAGAGLPALRFDYDGVGDSAGHDEDPGRVDAWLSSIRHAIDALRRASGCTRISLAGLRLGATLAAMVCRETDVSSLVVWAPCVRGRTYVRELKVLAIAAVAPAGGPATSSIEAGGFVVSAETAAAIAGINLEEVVPRARRVLVVGRDDFSENPALPIKWSAAGVAVHKQVVPGYVDMLTTPHNTKVPVQALNAIVKWMIAGTEGRSPMSSPETYRATAAPLATTVAIDGVQESLVPLGDRGDIFGVFTEPSAEIQPRTPIVVLSNAGATHHVGPGRLYVHLARSLARAGLRSIRFDLPGLGDSVLPDTARENNPYPDDASQIVASVIDVLERTRHATEFIVMGLCSGAHAAFHAALDVEDRPIVEAVLINPLTFYYAPGMPLDVPPSISGGSWSRFRAALRELGQRSALVRAATNAAKVAVRASLRWGRPRGDVTRATALTADLERLANRSRRVTFAFSQFDPGYDILMTDAGRVVRRSIARGQASLLNIKQANHTFDAMTSRGRLVKSLTAELASRYVQRALVRTTTALPAPSASSRAAEDDERTADRIRLLTFVTDFGCGGTERQVVNLGLALDSRRFALEYGCTWPSGQLLTELDHRGIPLTDYPIHRLYGPGTVRQQLRFARYLVRSRTQILHAYNFYCNVFAVPAAWLAGVPVIIASIRDRGVYLTAAQRHVQRLICQMADCVLVNAESIKEWLVSDGYDPSRIVVIRNGIDLPRFNSHRGDVGAAGGPRAGHVRDELGIPSDAPIVSMIARLNPQKGVEDFIDAAAIVSRQCPRARFLIVGEASLANHGAPLEDVAYRRALDDRATLAGLAGKLILTGYRRDVPALLAETAVSVLPSHSEGLSNTLLESMAAGVPVVATRVGGTPEAIDDGVTGLLVPAKAPGALAGAIARVLSDAELARQLGAAGRRSVHERFSVERMVRATERLYGDLLSRRATEPGWRGRLGLARPAFDAFAGKRPY